MKLPPLSNLGGFFPKPHSRAEAQKERPFSAVQIEVTSRCSTGCHFCPHDALSSRWMDGDMQVELYREHILPHLDLFDLVYLQGWGEPMLHPHLWDMLDMAQQKGCRTGFTTNGTWLADEQNNKILEMGVNLISVSFAGATAAIHESLRSNSDFSVLCHNFESLAGLKRQKGCADTWLELHFLMLRSNLSEFPALVELAASLGADEIVATNLAYSPASTLDHMHVFDDRPASEDLDIIACAKQTAGRLGIPLRVYPLQTEPNTLVCDADPLNTVYINYQGEMAPCVYLGLTVQGPIPRFYQGELHAFNAFSFGNVRQGFLDVLHGRKRETFVDAFERRNVSRNPLAVFSYLAGQSDGDKLPPPPAPCQFCYKMLGI